MVRPKEPTLPQIQRRRLLVYTHRYGRQCRLTFALICGGSIQNYSGTQPLDTRTMHVGSDRDAAFAYANLRVPTDSS